MAVKEYYYAFLKLPLGNYLVNLISFFLQGTILYDDFDAHLFLEELFYNHEILPHVRRDDHQLSWEYLSNNQVHY